MNYAKMTAGTRIYYTGDMANLESEGTIYNVVDSLRWGLSYDLHLDDGRIFRGVFPTSFTPGPGRRFWPLAEWEERRAERIKEMQVRCREMGLL